MPLVQRLDEAVDAASLHFVLDRVAVSSDDGHALDRVVGYLPAVRFASFPWLIRIGGAPVRVICVSSVTSLPSFAGRTRSTWTATAFTRSTTPIWAMPHVVLASIPSRGWVMSAEQAARQTIDRLLSQAGWAVQSVGQANLYAARGVAFANFLIVTPIAPCVRPQAQIDTE